MEFWKIIKLQARKVMDFSIWSWKILILVMENEKTESNDGWLKFFQKNFRFDKNFSSSKLRSVWIYTDGNYGKVLLLVT